MGLTLGNKVGVGKVRQGALLNQSSALISDIVITQLASSLFNISATIDTKTKNADVHIEYGLTSGYGDSILINEGIINGIVPVTATLTL